MATTFYQRQADAKKNSTRLIALFVLAVTLIVSSISVTTWLLAENLPRGRRVQMTTGSGFNSSSDNLTLAALTGGGALALIVLGSLYKVFQLRRGGGTLVAESLGGRRISSMTQLPEERKLMNIVEEMAIASGVPVPPVFVMKEDGINAFAAGYSPSDAVLGVTQGCIQKLNRKELQGVIAHEFSHILNGDMRISIKLIGILHGILLIGMTGHMVLRNLFYFGGGSRSRRSKKEGGGQIMLVILALAVVAIIVGFIGVFFGNLIKAAVSRQTEFLADASAVQFTRDPSGIADALKRIGGHSDGSHLQSANASEASHLFFSQAVWAGIGGLWATHPPLTERIKAIDPSWNGKFDSSSSTTSSNTSRTSQVTSGFAGSAQGSQTAEIVSEETSGNLHSTTTTPINAIHAGLNVVGEPTLEHRQYASQLIEQLPPTLLDAVHDPYSARAVIFCFLLDSDQEVQKKQLQAIKAQTGDDFHRLVRRLQNHVDDLDVTKRLPVTDLAISSLRSISSKQYREFIKCFNTLIKADEKIDLFEWIMIQVISRHLKPQFEKIKPKRESHTALKKLQPDCETLLSAISEAGNDSEQAIQAFQAGANSLQELSLVPVKGNQSSLRGLAQALENLSSASAEDRRRLIDACALAVEADGIITWQEAELLRGVADLLDCPIPPLLPS